MNAMLLAVVVGTGMGDVAFDERERRIIDSMSPAPALAPDPTNAVADDPAAARFGQSIFFDPRFSANGAVSCATCHQPEQAFTDGIALGRGVSDVERNTMTLNDVATQRWFFWDGRADTLWAQALEPFEDHREHAFTRTQVAHVINADPVLRRDYVALFGPLPPLDDRTRFPEAARPIPTAPRSEENIAWNAMTSADQDAINRLFVNVGKSIAAYERRLIGGPAAFDRFVEALNRGDAAAADAAMSPAAQRGLSLFIGKANCRLCHAGPRFSDGEFHSTGIPDARGGPVRDPGRFEGLRRLAANPFNAAGAYSDDRSGAAAQRTLSTIRSAESWGQFRTPTLRGVAETAPYMHAGTHGTLERVIRHYSTLADAAFPGHHVEQLLQPLHLSEREIADLAAFLRALTPGPVDPSLLMRPASGDFAPEVRPAAEPVRKALTDEEPT